MKKNAIEKVMFPQLFINHNEVNNKNSFYLYPEMPARQITHYIQLSNQRSYPITIQLKPSTHSDSFIELSGKIIFINHKGQIVIKEFKKNTVHLLQIKHIHHLRIAK